MPRKVVQAVEEYSRKQLEVQLKHAIAQYGIKVKLYEASKDVFSKVYGADSGVTNAPKLVDEIDAIVTSDDFFPTSATSSGGFIEGWLYTLSPKIQVGQMAEIVTSDGTTNRYMVQVPHGKGLTQIVFKRWKLVALGS
jgi:hypothetical protein